MTNINSHSQSTQTETVGGETKSMRRTLLGTPAALVVTAGLGLLMAGMIRVEYEALAEKPEKLSFIINEEVPDIEITRITEIPVLRNVETPPPPPIIETTDAHLPKTDLIEIDVLPPDPPKPEVRLDRIPISVGDSDPQPILRIPPVPPTRFLEGNNSGRCFVRFDVSAQGSPYNVVTTSCTHGILEGPTVKSVLKWKFRPRILDGQAVAMTGLKNEVVFQLLDERGNLLPEI